MSKTIKQRKDELMAALEAKKLEPANLVPSIKVTDALSEEYRNILYTNGIKNEKVLAAHAPRFVGMPKASIYSNLKFMLHLRTRLTEEGVPLKDAEIILEHVLFDMTDVNEDDDYVGTFALLYAEVLAKHYEALFGKNVTTPQLAKSLTVEEIKTHFNIMNVKLPAP